MTTLPGTLGKRSTGATLGGPGHTATLVGGDRYLWVSGARNGAVYVVDLVDPAAPKLLGSFTTPAGAATKTWHPGVVHDADVDPSGRSR